MTIIQCISPVDDRVYAERPATSAPDVRAAFTRARAAQTVWAARPVDERCTILANAIDYFQANSDAIALEIAWQMGRPVSSCAGEINGLEERARHMLGLAPAALADENLANGAAALRSIRREALGTILVIAPWNYPFLTATNAIFPALAAGNAVILKHSAQTLVCGERFEKAFESAGVPSGVFQLVSPTNQDMTTVIAEGHHDQIMFTGSVGVGRHLQQTNASNFSGINLELGGKDPAYVRADCDIEFAARNLVDGAFFNSGQSCCGIERTYVHESKFDAFVSRAVELTRSYTLGDPTNQETDLGPVVSARAADFIRGQIGEAVAQGARALIDEKDFPRSRNGSPYLAPQILVDVDHSMRVMTEESFGPVVGIMPVKDDDEAVRLMNDSAFGLTASIWTRDLGAAEALAPRIKTGTCFANRCDYLDPGLPWTGVKETGRGISLSRHAYDHVTRFKSYNFSRIAT